MDDRKTPQNYRLPPYGEITIDGRDTVALLWSDVPHVFLRVQSDCIRIHESHCIPVASPYVRLVNPFHFDINVQIAVGLPVRQNTRQASVDQVIRIGSIFTSQRPATVTGLKFGVGVMVKRGQAMCNVLDSVNDGFSRVLLFPKARADFMDLKPVTMMTDPTVFKSYAGVNDTNLLCCSGTYSDADVAAWVAAAGYTGMLTFTHASFVQQQNTFIIDENTAMFFARDIDKSATFCMKIQHLGAREEEFD